jgi:lipoprotein NlpI
LTTVEGLSHASGVERAAQLYLRGKIEAQLGRDREAERDLSEAFSRAPDRANYALDLGLICIRERNCRKAMDVFARGARFHRDSQYVKLGLALA